MRALVISGGATHGAYSVGAVKYLINDLNIQYDMFAGVSVGALNCSYLSMFSKEQEKDGFVNLLNIWQNLDNSKIRKNWIPFGILSGLWMDSVYNSQPLIDLVHGSLDLNKVRASGRKIGVGAVSMTTGNYKTFTQDDDCFVDAVLASSSYPMGLKPIVINGEKYTDGGLKRIIPIQEAIDFGATDIDVICCGPPQTTSKFTDIDVVSFGMRGFDLMTDQISEASLTLAFLYNKLVEAGLDPTRKYLNIKVIRPIQDLQLNPLDFNNTSINQLIDQGYKEAKEQYTL